MSVEKNQMYFASNPDSEHDEHVIDYHVNGIDLKFNTDAGVFSKLRVDYGSGVLIKTMSDVISLPIIFLTLALVMAQLVYLRLSFGLSKWLIWLMSTRGDYNSLEKMLS